jgi:hypothetical protein
MKCNLSCDENGMIGDQMLINQLTIYKIDGI